MKIHIIDVVTGILITTLGWGQSSDIFPAEPFNGMQINYSLSGVSVSGHTDTPGFTYSRSLTIANVQQPGVLALSGSLRAGGFGCTVTVTLSADDQSSRQVYEVRPEAPQNFQQQVAIPKNVKSVSVNVHMHGHYSMGGGSRYVVLAGSWVGESKESPPTKSGEKMAPPMACTSEGKEEAIAFHSEMVELLRRNLEREIDDRDKALAAVARAQSPKEAEELYKRVKEFDTRIIHLQSNMQAEQDLVASYQTGTLVHNRTLYDEYVRNKFIEDTKRNAALVDATRRMAQGVDRQISLLPPEMRAKARERVASILDAKTIASGDIAKVRQLAGSLDKIVQGYAEYDAAVAQEIDINSQQNEFYAQMVILAAGAGAASFGGAALAEAYGAEAAATIYGAKLLGALYGGTTGMIAGGPKEGLTQAVSWWSPQGYAAMEFLRGYQNAGMQTNATLASQTWEGAKQAGEAYFLGKAFELGTRILMKGSMVMFGQESRLFKPALQPPSHQAKLKLDALQTKQKMLNAQDEVATFKELEHQLGLLRQTNPSQNAEKIRQLEGQLNQLAAGLNSSYHAKWLLKYKAHPTVRTFFDRRVQQNYQKMTPGMVRRLQEKGYKMENIEFVQRRNSSSGGSSSMDLDLSPVAKGSSREPNAIFKNDGNKVTMQEFMDDAQRAMNEEYHQLFGISANLSEMNLVTSVHPEAYSTTQFLKKKINFSAITPDDIASVGKVLKVKIDKIGNDPMLTKTAKLQAQCRETSKEIENIFLKKLRDDLAKAEAGSTQRIMLENDIRYWEDILRRFKQMGMAETNPMELINLNRQLMRDTGGKDAHCITNDLINYLKGK